MTYLPKEEDMRSTMVTKAQKISVMGVGSSCQGLSKSTVMFGFVLLTVLIAGFAGKTGKSLVSFM